MGAVLALNPSIMILDEPMSHLDNPGREMVRRTLKNLSRQGRTLMIIEHDLNLVGDADRWLILEKGSLIRVDTPQNILTDENFCRQHKLILP